MFSTPTQDSSREGAVAKILTSIYNHGLEICMLLLHLNWGGTRGSKEKLIYGRTPLTSPFLKLSYLCARCTQFAAETTWTER